MNANSVIGHRPTLHKAPKSKTTHHRKHHPTQAPTTSQVSQTLEAGSDSSDVTVHLLSRGKTEGNCPRARIAASEFLSRVLHMSVSRAGYARALATSRKYTIPKTSNKRSRFNYALPTTAQDTPEHQPHPEMIQYRRQATISHATNLMLFFG